MAPTYDIITERNDKRIKCEVYREEGTGTCDRIHVM